MSEQKIKEGNKLIAEFCNVGHWQVWRKNGYKPHWSTAYISSEAAMEAARIHYGTDADEFESVFITPKYNSDWSELMPVVEKIEQMKSDSGKVFSVVVRNHDCHIYMYDTGGASIPYQSIDGHGITKIESTWQAVVEFIKWYNQHKQEIK